MIFPLDDETQAVAETAACLWEGVINGPDDWTTMREPNDGTAELRSQVVALAPYCDKAWEIACCVGYDAPFDWDFVPAFLSRCINWQTVQVKPDWPEIAIKIGRNS